MERDFSPLYREHLEFDERIMAAIIGDRWRWCREDADHRI
jgi:hypothetical protein